MKNVTYKIPGMTGEKVHERGPYCDHDAEVHAHIGGYEGVTEVRIVEVPELGAKSQV